MKKYWLKIRTLTVTLAILTGYFAALYWVVRDAEQIVQIGVVGTGSVFLIAEYIAGKNAALRAVGATEVQNEMLDEIVADLADEMGVPKPDIYIGKMGVPNAFAVGRKGSGAIVLSAFLIEELNPEQLTAVVAHELSHLKSRDTTLMTVGYSVVSILHMISRKSREGAEGIVGALLSTVVVLASIIARGLVLIPLRAISRYREYIADWDAARYTGNPEALASALERIAEVNTRRAPTESAAEVTSLCIIHMDESLIEKIFGSHPPVNERTKRLRKMKE